MSEKAMIEPVRVGVVGLGEFGRLHAATLAGLCEAELVALVEPDESRRRDAAQKHGGVAVFAEVSEALAHSSAEAWVVASSTRAHVPIAHELLSAGASVLLEKPLALTLAEAERLDEVVQADSRNLMLGHILLFNSEFVALRAEAVQRGPICYGDFVQHRPARFLDQYRGESPFHLSMVHDLYLAQVLMDLAEPMAVTGRCRRRADGACDLALAELTWSDGCLMRLAASFLTPEGLGSDGFDRIEVFGEGWTARLCPNPRPIELWDTQHRRPMTLEIAANAQEPYGMLARELRCFCRVVRGMEAVPAGARYQDGVQVMRWLDRLEASAGLKQT